MVAKDQKNGAKMPEVVLGKRYRILIVSFRCFLEINVWGTLKITLKSHSQTLS